MFSDERFSVRFKYPPVGMDGEPVETVETQQEGWLRVHVLTPWRRDVYFEVTRYDLLPAKIEYQRHTRSLSEQLDPFSASQLTETLCASLPAYEYSFEWEQGRQDVVLVERVNVTYRLLYKPDFDVNVRILSTVEWLNLP